MASRSRVLHRHLRLSESHVVSRNNPGPSSQSTTTQIPDLGGVGMFDAGGGGIFRREFDSGLQENDQHGDGGGNHGERYHGSSIANSDGRSLHGVDKDNIAGNSSKNSGSEKFESPISSESVTSHGSSLKAAPSASINTQSELHHLLIGDAPFGDRKTVLADAPNSSSTFHLGSKPSSSSPATRMNIHTSGVATSSSSNATPSSPATSSDFIAPPQTNLSKRSNYGAIAGGSVGALAVVLLILAAWILYKRWHKNRPLLPCDEFVNTSSASYPFAHAGFSCTIRSEEKKKKSEMTDGIYHSTGTNAAGQAEFKPSCCRVVVVDDPAAQGVLSKEEEKESQPGEYRDTNTTTQLPEVLYTTPPTRIATYPAASCCTIPRTLHPQSRRVPFGTGTFQFPRRPPESQGLGQGSLPS